MELEIPWYFFILSINSVSVKQKSVKPESQGALKQKMYFKQN